MRRPLLASIGAGLLTLTSAGCQMFATHSGPLATDLAPSQPAIKGTRVEDSPSETAKLRFATAQQLEAADKYEEAISLYNGARQLDPRFHDAATRHMAVLLDRQGDFDKARAEYDKILQKHPKDADTLNNLGYGYYNRGQWDLAEEQLRKAVAANPNHKPAWINLGMTLAQKRQYDKSLEAFAKAVPPAQAQANLAFILTTQGKRDEAKAAYKEALRIDPGLQLARNALAKLENPSNLARPDRLRGADGIPTSGRVRPQPVIDRDNPIIVDPADAVPVSSR
jgi:tetratricopeptide (TPR) repeat protein